MYFFTSFSWQVWNFHQLISKSAKIRNFFFFKNGFVFHVVQLEHPDYNQYHYFFENYVWGPYILRLLAVSKKWYSTSSIISTQQFSRHYFNFQSFQLLSIISTVWLYICKYMYTWQTIQYLFLYFFFVKI